MRRAGGTTPPRPDPKSKRPLSCHRTLPPARGCRPDGGNGRSRSGDESQARRLARGAALEWRASSWHGSAVGMRARDGRASQQLPVQRRGVDRCRVLGGIHGSARPRRQRPHLRRVRGRRRRRRHPGPRRAPRRTSSAGGQLDGRRCRRMGCGGTSGPGRRSRADRPVRAKPPDQPGQGAGVPACHELAMGARHVARLPALPVSAAQAG